MLNKEERSMLTHALKQCSVNVTETRRIVTTLAPILTSISQLSLELKARIRVRNANRQRVRQVVRVIGLSQNQKSIAKRRESLKLCSVGVGKGNHSSARGAAARLSKRLSGDVPDAPPAKKMRHTDVIDSIPDLNDDSSLTSKQKAWYEDHWPALEKRYLSLSVSVSPP